MQGHTETEITIYCLITNPQALEGLDREEHVQLEARFEVPEIVTPQEPAPDNPTESNPADTELTSQYKGKCRVRRTEVKGQVRYECTLKVLNPGKEGLLSNIEETIPCTDTFMESFRKIAKSQWVKTRYHYHPDQIVLDTSQGEIILDLPLVYEIDVFTKTNGEKSNWVKIDLEVDELYRKLDEDYPDMDLGQINLKLSSLPIKPVKYIISEFATDEQRAFIDQLFQQEFNQKPQ